MAQKRNDDMVQLLTPDFVRRKDVIGKSGGLVLPIVVKDPKAVLPADRPPGRVGEMVYYSTSIYFCTDAVTPTWEQITSA